MQDRIESEKKRFDDLRKLVTESKAVLTNAERDFKYNQAILDEAIQRCHHAWQTTYDYVPHNEHQRDIMSGHSFTTTTNLYERYKVTACPICGTSKRERA